MSGWSNFGECDGFYDFHDPCNDLNDGNGCWDVDGGQDDVNVPYNEGIDDANANNGGGDGGNVSNIPEIGESGDVNGDSGNGNDGYDDDNGGRGDCDGCCNGDDFWCNFDCNY